MEGNARASSRYKCYKNVANEPVSIYDVLLGYLFLSVFVFHARRHHLRLHRQFSASTRGYSRLKKESDELMMVLPTLVLFYLYTPGLETEQ